MSLDVGGNSGHVNFAALLQPGVGNGAHERTTVMHKHLGVKGDLTVQLHYGDFDTGHGRQAALYIFRAHADKGVYVPLSAMWQYLERAALHILIPVLAEQLYTVVTKFDQIRVMDAVMDYLDDLRKSPPDPLQFKDKSLDKFLEGCEDEGLNFFVDVRGKRIIG
ncbi:MAG: hypothetical protein ABIY56_00065 [Dokdonella sp.]